ncbi:MAG: helix-turn-helix domain-containing protein [Paludibacter sp.]|nr:helix-turn-helix domain-containing protein [Paludibacter sp.]
MARIFDPEKLAKLHDTGAILDRKYGERGTATRSAFEEKAYSAYYAEILRDRRKELKMTQQQLANNVGKKRTYIANVERGCIDMQISSFTILAQALGIRLNFSYV